MIFVIYGKELALGYGLWVVGCGLWVVGLWVVGCELSERLIRSEALTVCPLS